MLGFKPNSFMAAVAVISPARHFMKYFKIYDVIYMKQKTEDFDCYRAIPY